MSIATGMPASLMLVGAGKMGGAMLAGWLDAGLTPSATTVIDPFPSEAMTRLCAERGVALTPPDPIRPGEYSSSRSSRRGSTRRRPISTG